MKDATKGVIFAILTPTMYSLRSLTIKLSPSIPAEFYVLSTSIFGFILFLPIFFKNRSTLVPNKMGLISLRAFIGVPGVICSIYGFQRLALVDAILLENSMPIFILFIVLLLKKEEIRFSSILAILLGFIGIFIFLKPKLDIWQYAAIAPLGAAFFGALMCVILSDLTKVNHPMTILFYTYLISIPCYAFLSFFSWPKTNPEIWGYIAMTSIFLVFFRYSLIKSFELLPAHVVGSWVYLGILFSALWDWMIWRVYPDVGQVFGGSMIIVSGLFVLRENRRQSAIV